LLGIGGSRNLSNVQIQWARIYKNNTTPMAYVLDCASRGTDLYLVEFIDAKAVKVHKLELNHAIPLARATVMFGLGFINTNSITER
jgi:hypothetical protein